MQAKVFLFLTLFCSLALSQTAFTAAFYQTNGPSVLSGRLKGTMYYSQPLKALRLSYSTGLDEITLYDESTPQDFFVFSKCGSSCQSSPLKSGTTVPIYYKTSSDSCSGTRTLPSGATCTPCTRSGDPTVSGICVDSKNQPVQISLKDGTNYEFPSGLTTSVASSQVDPVGLGWGCVLNCESKMDIVLVVDESGSITGNYDPKSGTATGDWKNVRDFAAGFVNSFTIAPDKVNMGLVQFQSYARDILPTIVSDQAQFRSVISSMYKSNGGTCINCGMQAGYKLLIDKTGARALRANVDKLILLMTDGQDGTYTDANKAIITNAGIKIVAVGVGSGVDKNNLVKWASSSSLFFTVDSFNILASVDSIKKLSAVVCTSSGSTPCPGCLGLCACGSCLCPSDCEDFNACTDGACNSTFNSHGGCLFKAKNCDDKNACTDDSCDTKTGCVNTNFNVNTRCDDKDKCTTESCDKKIGCVNTPVDCTNKDPCFPGQVCQTDGTCSTVSSICTSANPCVTNNGCSNPPCTFTAIDCTGGNKCILPDCDIKTGCKNLTRDCDDGNACSQDTCDPSTGCSHTPINCDDSDPCTDDTCDPTSGCVHTPINITERCSNGDICSVFSCEKGVGCVSKPVNCTNNYNDTCIEVVCDSVQGCVAQPLLCNLTGGEDPSCYIGFCDNSLVDKAGVNRSDVAKAKKTACTTKESDNCVIAKIGTAGAAVLGAGAIAAIIIAAVVCAGGTTAGVVLGYNKLFTGEFENKSQIYEPETKVGQSGIFEGKK